MAHYATLMRTGFYLSRVLGGALLLAGGLCLLSNMHVMAAVHDTRPCVDIVDAGHCDGHMAVETSSVDQSLTCNSDAMPASFAQADGVPIMDENGNILGTVNIYYSLDCETFWTVTYVQDPMSGDVAMLAQIYRCQADQGDCLQFYEESYYTTFANGANVSSPMVYADATPVLGKGCIMHIDLEYCAYIS